MSGISPYTGGPFSIQGPQQGFASFPRLPRATRSLLSKSIGFPRATERFSRFVFRNTGETKVRYAHARSGNGDRQQPIEATNVTLRARAAENPQIDKSAATQRI